MAIIGVSIESGAVQTILLEPSSGEVLCTQKAPSSRNVASALFRSVAAMRTSATWRQIDVDGVGVVYRSEEERAQFAAAFEDEQVVLSSASESFLGWLARSEDFADADTVLLYYMGTKGVLISLADKNAGSVSAPRTATLVSISPERIGSTIPLAWEVVDASSKKPDAVALFGDESSNRDVVDILALGLGVPVVRVGDADLVAASGAAHLAHRSLVSEADPEPVPPIEPDSAVVVPGIADRMNEYLPPKRAESRRALAFAGMLLAGVLTAGIAVVAFMPVASGPAAGNTAERAEPDADLVGATRQVEPVVPLDQGLPADLPPVVETVAPPSNSVTPPATTSTTPASTEFWPTAQPPVVQQAPRTPAAAPVPPTSVPAAPVPAQEVVQPPQFTVPAVVPESGKSQEQLEQEAWDRHWEQTGRWIAQEIAGG